MVALVGVTLYRCIFVVRGAAVSLGPQGALHSAGRAHAASPLLCLDLSPAATAGGTTPYRDVDLTASASRRW